MNLATVKIYEFSTGIQAEETPDGGWVSRGFTGEYMNKTIDPIPVAIQSAIANREFAVAEGASSDEPAIIGREVRGGGQDWSAIAVVTRGRDDKGRKPTMYRYFFCEGAGNLSKILSWMNTQRPLPIFSPFDRKVVEQPTIYQDLSQPLPSLRSELNNLLANNAPIIVSFLEPCPPLIINQMATEKARQIGQPVAWAYKAEALEQPRSFQVIQPASEKAEQLLQRAIASTPQYSAPIAGEQEVKSAIKGLISRDKVKLDQVQAIETAINQIQDNDWEAIFNGQGASQALKQGIYSPQMVRLLTLRAMVIPQKLPEFLDWMQKREKQEEHYQVSEVFQSEITNFFTQNSGQVSYILSQVDRGVKLIIPHLIDRPELLNPTVWLLNAPSGIWRKLYARLSQNIKNELTLKNPQFARSHNLTQMQNHQSTINDDRWKQLFNELKVYWQNRSYPPDEKYLPLAELFSGLEETEITAFFYHVSLGCVPKKIFFQLNREGWNSNVFVYGLRIKKQVGVAEFLFVSIIKIGLKKMPIALVIVLLVLTFFGGFWSGGALKGSKKLEESPGPYSHNSELADQPGIPNRERSLPEEAPQVSKPTKVEPNNLQIEPQYQEGMKKEVFQETVTTIDKIIKEVRTKNQNIPNDEITNTLNNVLGIKDLSYENAKKGDPKERVKLVKALYQYQEKEFGEPLGFINNGRKKTIEQLKKDIQDRL